MDQRIIDFVAGLRAAGVRILVAESEDAFKATRCMGIVDRDLFQDSLRTTLVKEATDRPIFDQLFPLYFGSDGPPMLNLTEDLSPEEKNMLQQALRALLEQMRQQDQQQTEQQGRQGQPSPQQLNNLWQLLQAMLQGQNPDQQMMEQAGRQAGLQHADRPSQQRWLQRRMMRQLGMQLLEQLMEQLAELLQQFGMGQKAIDELMEGMEANREALAEQIGQYVGQSISRQQVENQPDRQEQTADLMHRPFKNLNEAEIRSAPGTIAAAGYPTAQPGRAPPEKGQEWHPGRQKDHPGQLALRRRADGSAVQESTSQTKIAAGLRRVDQHAGGGGILTADDL